MTEQDFRKGIETFVAKCQLLVNEAAQACDAKCATNRMLPELYIESIKERWCRIATKDGEYNAVYCFVDRNTGEIFQAGGWKAPVKLKTYLGNIFDKHGGMLAMTGGGPSPKLAKQALKAGAEAIVDEATKALAKEYVVDGDVIRRKEVTQ
jgi:hypothetical protein